MTAERLAATLTPKTNFPNPDVGFEKFLRSRDISQAPPAGFEPAASGLEVRCSIRTELQGQGALFY
jgi:hypothetical protein